MRHIARYLTAAFLSAMLLTTGCGKKEAPKPGPEKAKNPQPARSAGDSVKHKVLSFNLEGLSERGAKKWDVNGESAEAISENQIKLDNIVAKAYGEEAQTVITADRGIYDRTKNNVTLEQNVKATIEATQGFTGNFVDFSPSPAGSKPGDTAKPDAGSSDKAKKTKTVITCDGEVQFDYEQNRACFLKNVKVVSEDGFIDADKITVYLDTDTKRMKEIVAEGNVKITRGENITYSDKASYVEADKKITLMGRPKLILYQEGGMSFDTDFIGEGKKK